MRNCKVLKRMYVIYVIFNLIGRLPVKIQVEHITKIQDFLFVSDHIVSGEVVIVCDVVRSARSSFAIIFLERKSLLLYNTRCSGACILCLFLTVP